MQEVETFNELAKEYRNIRSVVCDTDRWLCKAFMFLIRNGFGRTPPPKQKRKPSAYNLFFGEQMKKGKAPAEIAALWRSRK